MFSEEELKKIVEYVHFKDMIKRFGKEDMDLLPPNNGNFCNMILCPKSDYGCTKCKAEYRKILKKHLIVVDLI